MIDVLWHGRGGQGAFTAAKLLGAAYAVRGSYSIAFPSFGPERRGAPVRAFTKLDSCRIGDRSEIEKADYVIYLDDTLFFNSFDELKENEYNLLPSRYKKIEYVVPTFEHTPQEYVQLMIEAEKKSLALLEKLQEKLGGC